MGTCIPECPILSITLKQRQNVLYQGLHWTMNSEILYMQWSGASWSQEGIHWIWYHLLSVQLWNWLKQAHMAHTEDSLVNSSTTAEVLEIDGVEEFMVWGPWDADEFDKQIYATSEVQEHLSTIVLTKWEKAQFSQLQTAVHNCSMWNDFGKGDHVFCWSYLRHCSQNLLPHALILSYHL